MFNIGDNIRFKYTGMAAEILADHMDGSYTVWLEEEDEESIAFVDDIVLEKDFKQIIESAQQKEVKKAPKGLSTEDLFFSKEELELKKKNALSPKHLQTAQKTLAAKSKEEEVQFVAPPIVATAPTETGCYLAFYPTSPLNYTIYLVNDSLTSFSFEFKLYLHKQLEHGFNKLIPANTFFAIGEFLQAQFNDSPYIEFKCPKFNFETSIKLKYKKFAATEQVVPLMGLSTYCFQLFKKLNPYDKQHASIKDYTQQQQQDKAFLKAPMNKLYQAFDLMDVASFEDEVDLHAEKLVNDTSEFTPKELYELQLEVLETFINKALALGFKEVFVIHGLGKGKLKNDVDNYLRYHGDVKSYKNEFHEKYGWGATKVIFK